MSILFIRNSGIKSSRLAPFPRFKSCTVYKVSSFVISELKIYSSRSFSAISYCISSLSFYRSILTSSFLSTFLDLNVSKCCCHWSYEIVVEVLNESLLSVSVFFPKRLRI